MFDTDGDSVDGKFWVCPWCGALFTSSHARRDHMQSCPQKPEDD